MRLRTALIPDHGLGPGPHEGKLVDYRLQLNDELPTEMQAAFGESIDVQLGEGTGDIVRMWVRFPWAEDAALQGWREP